MISGNCTHRSSKPFVQKELNIKWQKYKTVFWAILMITIIIMKKNCLKTREFSWYQYICHSQKFVCKKSASFYFKRLYIASVKSLILKRDNSKSVSKICQINTTTLACFFFCLFVCLFVCFSSLVLLWERFWLILADSLALL